MPKMRRNGKRSNPEGKELRKNRVLSVLGSRRNKQLKIYTREDFASGYEFKVYKDASKRGLRIEYEPLTFDYERGIKGGRCSDCGSGNCVKRARYTPDFRIGGKLLVETKGKFDPAARQRMDDFVRSRPNIPVFILFGYDNWTTRKHIQRYTDWCRERGITAAVGDRLPEDWLTSLAVDNKDDNESN